MQPICNSNVFIRYIIFAFWIMVSVKTELKYYISCLFAQESSLSFFFLKQNLE